MYGQFFLLGVKSKMYLIYESIYVTFEAWIQTAQAYAQMTLEDNLVCFTELLSGRQWIFQKDNAHMHKERPRTHGFNYLKIKDLDWLFWQYYYRDKHKASIEKAWYEIEPEITRNLSFFQWKLSYLNWLRRTEVPLLFYL